MQLICNKNKFEVKKESCQQTIFLTQYQNVTVITKSKVHILHTQLLPNSGPHPLRNKDNHLVMALTP